MMLTTLYKRKVFINNMNVKRFENMTYKPTALAQQLCWLVPVDGQYFSYNWTLYKLYYIIVHSFDALITLNDDSSIIL
jgi:hypothetical protein